MADRHPDRRVGRWAPGAAGREREAGMPEVGLFVPTSAPDARPDTVLAFGQRAEAAGVRSLWVPDRLVFDGAEPLLALAALVATPTRARLGTCVLLGTLRPPALLAKMVATLDVLSGGRVTLGLGVGSRADDFAAAEAPYAERGPRMTELLQVLRGAWSGAPLQHAGRYYHLDVGPIGPRPVQAGGRRIGRGGNAEPALRRIGRQADGYVGSSTRGPAGVRRAWEIVRASAAAAGRDPDRLTLAALVRACVDDDPARAAERTTANARHYGAARGDATAYQLLGPPDACVRMAHEYFAAGVQVLIVAPVTAEVGHLDRLLGEVFPRL